jgi:hypothetical protein
MNPAATPLRGVTTLISTKRIQDGAQRRATAPRIYETASSRCAIAESISHRGFRSSGRHSCRGIQRGIRAAGVSGISNPKDPSEPAHD